MPRNSIQPRKAPRQARSQKTAEAILEAAARVLARDSLAHAVVESDVGAPGGPSRDLEARLMRA